MFGYFIRHCLVYVSQTRDQKRFTISTVYDTAASIHCLRHRTTGPAVQHADISPPQSDTIGLHPVAVRYYSFPIQWRVGG